MEKGASTTVTVADSLRSNWLVTLDRTWSLLTDDLGNAVFTLLPPGTYPVWIRRGGVSMNGGTIRVEAAGRTNHVIHGPRPR